ncbi:MAG: hypothetical protein OEW67_09340 [Cyclobacteriaceae bacterium]|nr:hypothetical protein [Cyclobacteriaceae bacterium]
MKLPHYAKYLFEIIAIFIGITLSLIVDEWRENRQNREETVKALKMIRGDLVADTVEYNRSINIYSYFREGYERQYILNKPVSDIDSLLNLYSYSYWLNETYDRKSGINAFESLSNRVIKNPQIGGKLSNYYSFTDNGYSLLLRKFVAENHVTKQLNFRYISHYLKRKMLDFNDKYSVGVGFIESQSWYLKDSSYNVVLKVNRHSEELKYHLLSKEYLNLLSDKEYLEKMLAYSLLEKNRNAKELINLIDKELSK